MALQIKRNPTSSRPSIPKPGRKVDVTFSAQTRRGTGFLKVEYEIGPTYPYVFAGPTNANRSKVFIGKNKTTDSKEKDYSEDFTLAKVAGQADQLHVSVDVRIFETDANGEPVVELGEPVPPKRFVVSWTVE